MSYQLNNLKRGVLITAAEAIFHAPTKHTLDNRSIENSIIIAEERFIRPLLGTLLYAEMVAQKNVTITADNLDMYQARIMAAGYEWILLVGDVLNSRLFLGLNYRVLWDEYLWKLVSECVMVTALPEGFVQFGTEGAIHNQPTSTPMGGGGVATPGLSSMKWALDTKIQSRVDPLLVAVENYLRANRLAFPLYPVPDDICGPDELPVMSKKSNWVLNIYDDND